MLNEPVLTIPSSRLQPSLAGVLEIQVGLVHAVRPDFGQGADEMGLIQAKGGEQQVFGKQPDVPGWVRGRSWGHFRLVAIYCGAVGDAHQDRQRS